MKKATLILLLLFIFFGVFSSQVTMAEEADELPWHRKGWKYRTVFSLVGNNQPVQSAVEQGKLYARLDLQTNDKDRNDGKDIRVLNEKGLTVRAWTGKRGKNGVRTIYCRPGKTRFVVVYYGNEEPDERPSNHLTGSPSALYGLEMKQMYSQAAVIPNLTRFKAYVDRARVINVSNEKVVKAKQPSSGGDYTFISVFSGYFHALWDGEYFFGTDSHGPSFIEVNGCAVASWPGSHWKQGSYVHGGKIKLRRGVYSFDYYYQRIPGGMLAEAGWRGPGFPDAFEISPNLFVRFAQYYPVSAGASDGTAPVNTESIQHLNVTMNCDESLSHLSFKAYGGETDKISWKLDRKITDEAEDTSKYKYNLPYIVKGRDADFYITDGSDWYVSLLYDAKEVRKKKYQFESTKLVLPMYFECEMDCLPEVAFRGSPFSMLLNVPNNTSFTPNIDIEVIQKKEGKIVESATIRKRARENYHLVTDFTFDPRMKPSFAYKGSPFTTEPSDPDPDFFRSQFVFNLSMSGIHFRTKRFSFLDSSDPVPPNAGVDKDGILSVDGSKLVIVSDIEDDGEIRRWAIFKTISKLGEEYRSFCFVGDDYAPQNGILSKLAEKMKGNGKQAVLHRSGNKPFPLYSAIVDSFADVETGKYECVVVSAGYEDAFARTSPLKLQMMIQAFNDRCAIKGVKKVILLLPPSMPGYEGIMNYYREAFSATAGKLGLDMIDLAPTLAEGFVKESCSLRWPESKAIDDSVDLVYGILCKE